MVGYGGIVVCPKIMIQHLTCALISSYQEETSRNTNGIATRQGMTGRDRTATERKIDWQMTSGRGEISKATYVASYFLWLAESPS